jgi:hypothetical protein
LIVQHLSRPLATDGQMGVLKPWIERVEGGGLSVLARNFGGVFVEAVMRRV